MINTLEKEGERTMMDRPCGEIIAVAKGERCCKVEEERRY